MATPSRMPTRILLELPMNLSVVVAVLRASEAAATA
jgi:hypothetical protein